MKKEESYVYIRNYEGHKKETKENDSKRILIHEQIHIAHIYRVSLINVMNINVNKIS